MPTRSRALKKGVTSGTVNRRQYLKAVSAAGLTGGLAGCFESSGEGSNTIRIGQITPLSGPFVQAGENVTAAGEAMKANLESEISYDIELSSVDSQTDPATGQQEAEKMIQEEDMDIITSTGSGSVGLSVSKVCADNEVLNLCAGGQDPITTDECQAFTFNMTGRVDTMGNGSIPWMAENEGIESFAFLSSDYGWGHDAWAAYEPMFDNLDAEVEGNVFAPFGATDFSNQIQQLDDMNPEVVGITAWGTDIIQAVNQMDEFGVDFTPLIMWTSISVMKGIEDMDGVWASGEYYWDIEGDGNQEFVDEFEGITGSKPPVESYNEYVGLRAMVQKMDELGTTDSTEVATELEGSSINPLKGGTGELRECDHQYIEDWFILEGKATSKQESEDDVADVAARRDGAEIAGECRSECDLPYFQ